ncbi:MAG: hypothetical protein NW215_01850 [Hyphomicrobiales bacterium]|nr:hypothetical protein [Hyphomicrobiales bacterium]
MTSIVSDERLKSVAFFLSDALRSILEDGQALRAARCSPPLIGPEASCDEIFEQLESFRREIKSLRGREAFMIAKLARARGWAKEMRTLAPALKPEINLFLLATVFSDELQQAIAPSAQTMFHGGGTSRRFLDDRAALADESETAAYLIAGKVRAEDLIAACESFLGVLDKEFALFGEMLDETDEADAVLDLTDLLDGEIILPPSAADAETAAPLH